MTSSLFCAERVRNFNGFTLKPGMWAGRDEKGFFACTRIMQKKDPGHHLHLYRLDKEMNRGWSMVWESSETTQEIMRAVLGAVSYTHLIEPYLNCQKNCRLSS